MSKVAVITGGSKGIGLEVVNLLNTKGFTCFSVSRSPHISGIDNGIKHFQCDVKDEEQVQHTLSQIMQSCGRVDILVNSAGVNKDSLLLKTKYSDIKTLLDTNLVGTILMCKWTVKAMLQQRSGVIVNLGSIIGQKGNIGQSIYSASKSGLIGFTKSLAKEVGSRGITANVVAPGFIATQMTSHINENDQEKLCKAIPLQRLGTARDVANMIDFVIHSPYITGQVLYCDGGYHTSM